MDQQVWVLVNPEAGRGRGAAVGQRAVGELRSRGCDVEVLRATDGEGALRLARAAVQNGARTLVAVGGDGLVNIAVQAVAGTGVRLGILASGTGNDIARALGLPDNLAEACDVVVTGHSASRDLGRAGGRWFAGILSAGFDSAVNARANAMRRPRGSARYPVAVVAELRAFRPKLFSLRVDGRAWSEPAMLVAVGNGPSYGGGMRMCPKARLDDGLLDVTVVAAMGRAEMLRFLPTVYSGRHVNHPAVTTLQARELRLDAPDVVAYADGELVGPLPLDVVCVPSALEVLVPVGLPTHA